jgi:hypothetical protein
MYKKITHDIVEEHFSHTATFSEGKLANLAHKAVNDGRLPSYVMNEGTMQFRMDARSAWAKWVWSLLNYSISLNGNLPGTEQVKGRMHKNAVALGDFLIPYYGLTASRAVTTALIAIDDVGMHYVEAMKANASAEELEKIIASWAPYTAALAKAMNELNPNNWPESLLSDILNNLVKGWQEELTARAKGDIIADEIAIDYINKLVVTGVPDHVKAGYSSLADLFSRGIIAQFPTMFAE